MLSTRSIGLKLLGAGMILLLAGVASSAQEDAETAHIAVENPADLSQDEANRIYDTLNSLAESLFWLRSMRIFSKLSVRNRHRPVW